jgi:type I restriction enzyme S subunit
MVRLGDIGQSIIGLTYSPEEVKRSGTLVLRSSNIQDGRLTFEDNVYVDSNVPDRIRIRDNDILICVRNGSRRLIGKSVMLDRRVVGQTFGAFMAVFRSDANPFLQYFFQSDEFKRQIDEHLGATINQITNGSLNSFVVRLPGQREQRAITARLQDIDLLIASLEHSITKKQAIKQGMMQELLTGRTRLPGFTRNWVSGTFEDLASPVKERILPALVSPDTPLVELEQIEPATGRLLARSTVTTATSLKTRFSVGDVLFGKLRAYLRKFWIADTSGLCTTEIWAFRSKPAVSGEFVRFVVETDGFIEVASGAYGTHMPRSDWQTVRRYELLIPELEEQKAIASVLMDADCEIELLRARLAKARDIKQGMMQELLTGRTRLPIQEAVA